MKSPSVWSTVTRAQAPSGVVATAVGEPSTWSVPWPSARRVGEVDEPDPALVGVGVDEGLAVGRDRDDLRDLAVDLVGRDGLEGVTGGAATTGLAVNASRGEGGDDGTRTPRETGLLGSGRTIADGRGRVWSPFQRPVNAARRPPVVDVGLRP